MQSTALIRRVTAMLSAAAVVLVGLIMSSAPANAVSDDVVISQVYGAGGNAGATYNADFVELFNRGTTAVSLAGMSIQYASASGSGSLGANSGQLTELPSVTLQPGQYYLVQQASGANGAALPTPDVVDPTPIGMAAAAGKVALAEGTASLGCNGGSAPCGAAQLARIVDLVGFGSANFFEGAGPAPTLNATTAAFRDEGGCVDTDNNAADFTATTPAPRNSSTPLAPCNGEPPVDTAPSVVSVSPQDGGTGAPNGPITITFSEPVDVADGAFSLTCTVSGGVTLTVSGGPTTFTLTPTTSLVDGDECLFSVSAAGVADVDTNDPPDTMAADFTSTFTVAVTLISEIQGSGLTTPLAGQVRTVEAVVTAVKPGLSGFYLQEEESDSDGNPLTSEGIFVFGSATLELVEVGDLARVTGTVGEFTSTTGAGSSQTQLTNATVEVLPDVVELPTPVEVTFPLESTTELERYEGMLVELVDELVISEYFNYDRFGEVVLAKPLDGQDRLHTPTAVVDPGPEAEALAAEQALRIITLDDYFGGQNPTAVPHPGNGEPFSTTNTFRGGDTVTAVVGVIDHTFGLYRIQPTDYGVYEAVNPRPAEAPEVGGSIQVASFNVLNYFLTLDQSGNRCGPLLNQDCRGADSESELERQRVKLVAAIAELDADVVGLMEMENSSGVEPAADLVEGLNDLLGAGTYDFIDTGVIGTDAIRLGFLYKPGTVRPAGDYAILDSLADPRFIDSANRPMLTQTFDEVGTGARVTVSVNHLKSKGSACTGDPDLGDGQGNCNLTRTAAAEAIADFLAGDPTGSGDPDHLVIGDLNSYDREDPIDVLVKAGYTDLVKKYGGELAYGYVFDGKVGYLDHALSNASLTPQVTGASEWHINADEPDILDYNLDFGRPASFFTPDPYRSSDHDPVLVGLDLDGPADFVADLRETLAGMDLHHGISNALDAKLRATERAIDCGDRIGACESLQSFINQVNALTGKKITPGQAETLIEEAVVVRRSLDC